MESGGHLCAALEPRAAKGSICVGGGCLLPQHFRVGSCRSGPSILAWLGLPLPVSPPPSYTLIPLLRKVSPIRKKENLKRASGFPLSL